METQTADVIDLAAYREARVRCTVPAVARETTPPALAPMAPPLPLLPPLPGYWLFWVPVLMPHYFAPSGALLDAH